MDRLVEAAAGVLVREGLSGFNTNRIAVAAGVGVGSLYEYFPDKDAILERIIDDMASREAEAIEELLESLADASLEEVIVAVVTQLVALYREHLPLYRALRGVASLRATVGTRPGEQRVLAAVASLVERHGDVLEGLDSQRAAFTLFHLVESLAFQMVDQVAETWSPQACIHEIVRAATGYLGLARG